MNVDEAIKRAGPLMDKITERALKKQKGIKEPEKKSAKQLREEVKAEVNIVDLSDIPIMSIPRERLDVVTVSTTDSCIQVLKTLAEAKVLSAPVLDKELDNYYGFVDMLDLVTMAIEALRGNSNIFYNDEVSILEQETLFASSDAFTAIDKSNRDPFIPVRASTPVSEVLKILVDKNVHRVPVFSEEDGSLLAIISQSTLLRYFYKNIDEWPTMPQKTLMELGLGKGDVVTVPPNLAAFNAFKVIVDKRVSSVGVLNKERELLGVLSATDIVAVAPQANLLQLLNSNVINFLQKMKGSANVITCTQSDTLVGVMKKLVENKVHRLFVVEGAQSSVITGVVSLRDILEIFLQHINEFKSRAHKLSDEQSVYEKQQTGDQPKPTFVTPKWYQEELKQAEKEQQQQQEHKDSNTNNTDTIVGAYFED